MRDFPPVIETFYARGGGDAPDGRRGFFTAWIQTTATLGIVVALAVILICRTALGDSSDNPRFVQTVPRKGYRFIAPVTSARPPSLPSTSVPPADLRPSHVACV